MQFELYFSILQIAFVFFRFNHGFLVFCIPIWQKLHFCFKENQKIQDFVTVSETNFWGGFLFHKDLSGQSPISVNLKSAVHL